MFQRVLNDNVCVLTIPDPKLSDTGRLHLPDDMDFYPLPTRGKVIAVGPGRMTKRGERLPMTTRVGDLVGFPKDRGFQVEKGKDIYMILREADLLYRHGRSA